MPTTFQKRQKEMKRLEKQRMKAERRAQKKLANRTENETLNENVTVTVPVESEPQSWLAGRFEPCARFSTIKSLLLFPARFLKILNLSAKENRSRILPQAFDIV